MWPSRVRGNVGQNQSDLASTPNDAVPSTADSSHRPARSASDPRLQGLERLPGPQSLIRGNGAVADAPVTLPPLLKPCPATPSMPSRPGFTPMPVSDAGGNPSHTPRLAFVYQSGGQTGNPLNLSAAEIKKIKGTHGGDQTLAYIADHWQILMQPPSRLSRTDIVKIAGRGGSRALEALDTLHDELRALGYTQADMVRIAANQGGAQALQKVRELHGELAARGYTRSDIVRMARNNGGSQALQKVNASHGELEELGYTRSDIVRMAGHVGGALALQKVLALHGSLRRLGYTKDAIVALASLHSGAARVLEQACQTTVRVRRWSIAEDGQAVVSEHVGSSAYQPEDTQRTT